MLIALFTAVFFLNALKPWIDYVTPINYQFITAFQFVLLISFVTLLNKNFYKKIDIMSALLLTFIILKFFLQTILDLVEGDTASIISALYVVIRTFFIVYLFQMLFSPQRQNLEFFNTLRLILVSYLFITVIYSLMQHPAAFNIMWIREYGGNYTSGSALAISFFRANGGIGGTVVDYANFLLAVTWVLLFVPFKNKVIQSSLLLLLFSAGLLCFSRSLFLAWLLIFLIHAFSFKNTIRAILTITIISTLLLLMMINIDTIFELYDGFTRSDQKRLGSWSSLFSDFTIVEFGVGRELGGNTGLFLIQSMWDSEGKISGDGFLTGFLYDAGAIMLLLFIGVIMYRVFLIKCDFRTKISIIVSLMVMTAINSGVEKLFIAATYILSIGIIYGFNRWRDPSNKGKKEVVI